MTDLIRLAEEAGFRAAVISTKDIHERLFRADKALVLQSVCEIGSYENKEAILKSKADRQ